jgi:nicotinate-nucleotide adenylyltransferase
MAESLRESHALDRVLFVPAYVSPFKIGATVTPPLDRLALVRLAIADHPTFSVWTGELESDEPSYTVHTLRRLRSEFPGAEFYFLLGTDALEGISRWREPETLLTLAKFVAAPRPGASVSKVRLALPDAWKEAVDFIEAPPIDLSSSEMRALVRDGKSLRYLTPEAVIQAIDVRGLYKAG